MFFNWTEIPHLEKNYTGLYSILHSATTSNKYGNSRKGAQKNSTIGLRNRGHSFPCAGGEYTSLQVEQKNTAQNFFN